MKKISHYEHLKNKWGKKHQLLQQNLLSKHQDISKSLLLKQHLISGLMLASTPFVSITPATSSALQPVPTPVQQFNIAPSQLVHALKEKLPKDVRTLTPDEEKTMAEILSKSFHMPVAAELNGIRLNRSYGLIGQEQHLRRFPGDTLSQHFENQMEENLYAPQGVAPGLGAWGYFADSKEKMTEKDKLREKYYIAVQTFLAPGWNEHVGEYGLFFKYRKMLVVNPENGKAVVADIADAGPADWTGKHLGGSPEVMQYLDRKDGAERGPVLYFFIDDPGDTIPLGLKTL